MLLTLAFSTDQTQPFRGTTKTTRKSVEPRIDDSLSFDGRVSHFLRKTEFVNEKHSTRIFFWFHLNQKPCPLILLFFSFQHATATDTPDDVVSIWSCTSSRAVFRAECVWTADTTHPDDIAITARRASTETRPSRSPTKRRADVSTGFVEFFFFQRFAQERLMTFPTIACLPEHSISASSIH